MSTGETHRVSDSRQTGNPALDPARYPTVEIIGRSVMTVAGTAAKAAVYMLALVVAAAAAWSSITPDEGGAVVWPWWTWWVGLGAFVVAMITLARPQVAAAGGFVYALLEGALLGAISAIYEVRFDGIVTQAVILTIAVLAATLALYLMGAVRATRRFTRGLIVAMGGLLLLYLFGWVMSLFGADAAFWARPTSFSLFFSVAIVALAAMNLVLDFDMIERLSSAGAPKQMEWYAAFGLILTLVWLYLEVIRLIALSRSRR
jgi:uncharacterized YccA/Bax inhibitor family protein